MNNTNMEKLAKNINMYHFTVRTIGSIIFYVSLILAIILPTTFYGESIIKLLVIILLSIITLLLGIYNFILPFFIFKLYGYRIDEFSVVIKRGVIFRKNIIVPIKRIQHIEKFQGPIQMLYKLSTIIIYTAGSNAMIIGVPQENTDQIISEIKSGLQNYLDSDEVIEDEA